MAPVPGVLRIVLFLRLNRVQSQVQKWVMGIMTLPPEIMPLHLCGLIFKFKKFSVCKNKFDNQRRSMEPGIGENSFKIFYGHWHETCALTVISHQL